MRLLEPGDDVVDLDSGADVLADDFTELPGENYDEVRAVSDLFIKLIFAKIYWVFQF